MLHTGKTELPVCVCDRVKHNMSVTRAPLTVVLEVVVLLVSCAPSLCVKEEDIRMKVTSVRSIATADSMESYTHTHTHTY